MIEYLDETAITWDRGDRPKSAKEIPETILMTSKHWRDGANNTIIKMPTESIEAGADPDVEDYVTTASIGLAMLDKPQIWYLTKSVCEIVKYAAKTLPTDMVPVPGQYGANRHFIWLETPYVLSNLRDGISQVQAIDAISVWCGYPEDVKEAGLMSLYGYSWVEGKLIAQRISYWGLQHSWFRDEPNSKNHNHIRATFHTIMSLISEKTLMHSEPASESANRSEIRRAKRSGMPLDNIRIVYLGTTSKGSNQDPGIGTKMSTRFVVSGHWRNQRCGPGNKYTKTIWISPHIKGPEDAPLVISKTVTVVK